MVFPAHCGNYYIPVLGSRFAAATLRGGTTARTMVWVGGGPGVGNGYATDKVSSLRGGLIVTVLRQS